MFFTIIECWNKPTGLGKGIERVSVSILPQVKTMCVVESRSLVNNCSDSEIVMVDRAFGHDLFEQNRSWDDFGTMISGIQGTHQNFIGSRMPFLLIIPRVDDILMSFR